MYRFRSVQFLELVVGVHVIWLWVYLLKQFIDGLIEQVGLALCLEVLKDLLFRIEHLKLFILCLGGKRGKQLIEHLLLFTSDT